MMTIWYIVAGYLCGLIAGLVAAPTSWQSHHHLATLAVSWLSAIAMFGLGLASGRKDHRHRESDHPRSW